MVPHIRFRVRRCGLRSQRGSRQPPAPGYHPTTMRPETILTAPKALLHDHLDGGLRPATVIDHAAEFGYDGLPPTVWLNVSR